MVENINKITLKGGYYDTALNINFFELKKDKCLKDSVTKIPARAILVYGENGSGKSSIADALHSYTKEENDSDYEVDFEPIDTTQIDDVNLKNNMHIYSEKFIDKEVKYAEEGLNAVVMFGEQTEIDKDIKAKEKEKENNTQLINDLSEKIEIAEKNIKTQFNLITDNLKKDGNWADLDKDIKGNIQKSAVTETTVNNIFATPFHHPDIKDFKRKFDDNLKFYKDNREGEFKKLEYINEWEIDIDGIKAIKDSLRKEYKRPIEKDTLKWLEQELTIRGIPFYKEVEKTMKDTDAVKCPYCTQNIDEELKSSVLSELNFILDDEIEKLTEELNQNKNKLTAMKKETIDIHKYESLEEENKNIISNLNTEINLFNSSLESIIKNIENKIDNPYKIYDSDLELPKNIDKKINTLNENIKKHNDKIDNITDLKKELIDQNNQLTNHEYYSLYSSYKKEKNIFNDLKQKLNKANQTDTEFDNEISILELKKSNTNIALDQINNYLRFIFFDTQRMYLQPTETGSYEVWTNNNRIKLSDLSIGERNIISLCYFFSKINENKDTGDKSPKLLIIDDPISSFDSQNKIGMLSFLRKQLFKFFTENTSNKILILTHDLYTAIQFSKILDDVKGEYKKAYKTYVPYELKNKNLLKLNLRKFNQISSLISNAALFTFNDKDVEYLDENIGNMLRRILEGYSTFNYKMDITELFNSSDILGKLNQSQVNYYSSRMYRLLLHGDSHLEDLSRSLGHLDSLSIIDTEEKKNLTKDVLSFLFEIDPLFLKKHINHLQSVTTELSPSTVIKKVEEHISKISTTLTE